MALVRDRGRIATVAGFARAPELGILLLGSGQGADPGTELRANARLPMLELAGEGLLVPLPSVEFPLDAVRDAMSMLAAGHSQGKLVLLP